MIAWDEYAKLTDKEEKIVKIFLTINIVAVIGAAVYAVLFH